MPHGPADALTRTRDRIRPLVASVPAVLNDVFVDASPSVDAKRILRVRS